MIGRTIAHYRILEKLGEGGMGIVYKAEDTRLARTVALKFLPRHLASSEADRARLLAEARSAATLNHPNVCVIHRDIKSENIMLNSRDQIKVMDFGLARAHGISQVIACQS